MIEYRRAWQAKALTDNTLTESTKAWIEQTVARFAEQGLIARPQLIRRPQRSDGLTLMVSQNGQLTGVTLENEAALQLLNLTKTALPEVAGPQYFVCTNAKRDLCCAKFGRPTYAALHQAIPTRVWQTTHVGGHRYAPNVLSLPDANMYGRVMADTVAEFLADTEQKKVARKFLRGNTGLSKLVQVATQSLIEQGLSPDAIRLLREDTNSATFATNEGVKKVLVTPSVRSVSVIASCGKPEEIIYPLTPQSVSSE